MTDRGFCQRLLRTCGAQPQSIQLLRACPEDCFADGKRKAASEPLPFGPCCSFSEQPEFLLLLLVFLSSPSFFLEPLVYAAQMCTMRGFCVAVYQMCSNRKMRFGKRGGLSISAASRSSRTHNLTCVQQPQSSGPGKELLCCPLKPALVTAKDTETRMNVTQFADRSLIAGSCLRFGDWNQTWDSFMDAPGSFLGTGRPR